VHTDNAVISNDTKTTVDYVDQLNKYAAIHTYNTYVHVVTDVNDG